MIKQQQSEGDILDIGGSDSVGWGRPIYVREATGSVGWHWRPITPDEKQKLLDAMNGLAV